MYHTFSSSRCSLVYFASCLFRSELQFFLRNSVTVTHALWRAPGCQGIGEICFKIRYVILGSLWRLTVRTMVARLFAFISILREEEDLWKIRKGSYAENTKVHTKQPPSWKMWVLLQCAEPDDLSNLFWIFYISYLNGFWDSCCWYEWI